MKKLLLGTSAVVGAAVLMAGQAQAELDIKFSGSLRQVAYFADTDGQSATGGGRTSEISDAGWSIDTNGSGSEIHWTAKGSSDHGFDYGARIDLRYVGVSRGSTSADENYVFFSGGFGTIHFGNDDNVIDNVVNGGEDVLRGGFGYDGRGNDGVVAPGGPFITGPDSALTGGGDRQKIAYYSPKFGGIFDVAGSIEPGNTGNNGTGYKNIYGLTARVQHDVNDVGFSLAFGYGGGEADQPIIGMSTASTTTVGSITDTTLGSNLREDAEFTTVSGKLTFAGFSLGAGWGDNGDTGLTVAQSRQGADAGSWYSLGAAYNFGPGGISVGYFSSEADIARGSTGSVNNQTSYETETFVIGADYTLAEGLSVFSDLQFTSLDGPGSQTANQRRTNVSGPDADQTVFLVGTRVAF